MKKIYALIGLWFIVYNQAISQTTDIETARRVAASFFQSVLSSESMDSLHVLTLGDKNQPSLFVFSLLNNWVLVAGDKRMPPILAYSDEEGGEFPIERDMPDGMWYMIEWYNSQINYLRKENLDRETHPQWRMYADGNSDITNIRTIIVNPLLNRNGNQNIWKQVGNNDGNDINKSYNKFCPSVSTIMGSCEHAVTGCVALAMGQVMWYWQWPYAAIVNDENSNQILRNYDWFLMPYRLTNLSSIAEADMVANLLHDIGIAVSMDYGCVETGGSSASPLNIATVFRNVFGYNAADLIYKDNYNSAAWIQFIKNELNEKRPVLYGGMSSSIGHRFVIDGYDSNSLFHINYGWGGDYNSYYNLNTIEYNSIQSMVRNIHPNYPSCTSIVVPSTDSWTANFIVQNGGSVTIGDRIVSSVMHGSIFSGESITLTSGFEIRQGAEVNISIRDMHCSREEKNNYTNDERQMETIFHSPQQRISETDSSGVFTTKILRDGRIYIVRGDKTYNLQGIEVH